MAYAETRAVASKQLIAKLKIVCSDCKKSFTFKGEAGFSTLHPTTNTGATELCIPLIVPDDEAEPTPKIN